MDRTRLNAILSGQQTLKGKAPAAPVVLQPDEKVQALASTLGKLTKTVAGARPLALASSQLPAIF